MRLPLLALLAAWAVPAFAQGRLAFDAERYEFGRVAEGDTAVHVFAFTNAGDEAVRLADVQASCGCTTPSFTVDPIAPGDRGRIVVAYDSRGRPGPFEKTVAVTASGAEPAHTLLRIAGTVEPGFASTGVRMGSLVFAHDAYEAGTIDGGALQHAFRFYHAGDRPLKVLGVEAPSGVEVFAPERPVFPGDVFAVVVSVESPAQLARPDGEVEVVLVAETDDAVQPAKRLRVTARTGSASD